MDRFVTTLSKSFLPDSSDLVSFSCAPGTSTGSMSIAEERSLDSSKSESDSCGELAPEISVVPKKNTKRSFQASWKKDYPWLEFDEKARSALCSLCRN